MESLSPEAQQIIDKAQNWTFVDDNTLLQWMQKISQNLEQRATHTSEMLQQLNLSVKRTGTALENVSNSLTALQYTQFVENRVHDDDDDITKVDTNNEPTTTQKTPQSSAEMQKIFLNNNLKMLNSCHEKYAVEFDDSDDESNNNNNCIYQPKDPYNERLLPHIYGSKLWKEKWHVGLSDGPNDYSAEESDAFSESSASTEDNTSVDTNSANMSSNTSLTNEKYPAKLAVQNASQPYYPSERMKLPYTQQIAAGSDDSSSIHSQTANQSFAGHDLFTPVQNTSSSTSTSVAVNSIEVPQSSKSASSSDEHTQKKRDGNFENVLEPPLRTDQTHTAKTVPIKRKPVNLFDDEDFNSFMNEITDKVQTKPKTPDTSQEPTIQATVTPTAAPRRAANTFDATNEGEPTPTPTTYETRQEKPLEVPKKKAINLFDSSPENSPPKSNTLLHNSDISSKPLNTESIKKDAIKPFTTPKSLFDDDDEDDDFLNVFGKKKTTAQTQSNVKTLFFDNDMDVEPEPLRPENRSTTTTKNVVLFPDESDSDENANSLFSTSKPANTNYATGKSSSTSNDLVTTDAIEVKPKQEQIKRKMNLFDDEESEPDKMDDDLFTSGVPKVLTSMPKEQIYAVKEISSKADSAAKNKDKQEETNTITEHNSVENAHVQNDELFPNNKSASDNTSHLVQQFESQNTDLVSNRLLDKNESFAPTYDTFTSSTDDSKLESNDNSDITQNQEQNIISNVNPTTSTPEFFGNKNIVVEDSGIGEIESTCIPTSLDESGSEQENTKSVSTEKGDNIEKVPVLSNYMNIFSDEPPEDDGFFQALGNNHVVLDRKSNSHNDSVEDVFDEPALPELPIQDKTERQPASSDYSGLRLFCDIPPDDDGDNANTDVNIIDSPRSVPQESLTSLQNVFYDDFSETIEAIKQSEANKMPVCSLFDDEPPSDNDDFIESSIKKRLTDKIVAPTIDANNIIDDKRLGQSVIKDETDKVVITAHNMEEKRNVIPAEKPKAKEVSKLPKVNINVQALLPNAGGKLNFKKSTSMEDKSVFSTEQQTSSVIVVARPNLISSVSVDTQKRNSNDNLLQSLCKTRVRAPPKRRPSTRKGRQENYRKSMLLENDNGISEYKLVEDLVTPSMTAEKKNTIVSKESIASSFVFKENDQTNQQMTQPKPRSQLDFNNMLPEDEDNFISDMKKSPISLNPSDKSNILDNSHLPAANTETLIKPITTSSSSTETKQDSKYQDVTKEPISKDVVTSTASMVSNEPLIFNSDRTAEIEQKLKGNMTSVSKSSFEPQLTDNASSTRTLSNISNDTQINQVVKPSVPTASQLFGDSGDSDVDDIFGSKQTKSSQIKVDNVQTSSTSISNENKSIFLDDKNELDSDDDLFKKIESKATSKQTTQKQTTQTVVPVVETSKKPASLFESDNEDNDDFLSSIKSSKPEKPKPVKVESGKNLFSDDSSDGDDDLFGVAKSKSSAKSIVTKRISDDKTNPSTVKSATNAKTDTSIADNPLADLL